MAAHVDRIGFLALLTERFPEIVADVNDCSQGLLHLEMATFARATQAAIDAREIETVKRHFRFADEVLRDAAPDVEAVIDLCAADSSC